MFRRILIASGVVLLFVAVAVAALMVWRNRVIDQRNRAALVVAEKALSNAVPRQALAVINARPPGGRSEQEESRWFAAEVEACARLGLLARLQTLLRQDEAKTLANEDAALLLARSFLHSNDEARARGIAEQWESRSARPELWFSFRVDADLLLGRRKEAIELLNSRKFSGTADALRLSRLALLRAGDDPAGAWNLLAEAYRANPRDTDVRSFRGQILETLGSNRLAQVEYVAAHVARPENLLLRDQLAEFYRRRGNHLNALQTWAPTLTNGPPAYLPLKFRFWSRVARSVPTDAAKLSSADPLAELVNHLAALPADRFWNAEEFELLANRAAYERTRQECFWLPTLEHLRRGESGPALEKLRINPFRARSYDPLLDRALYAVLSWQKNQRLDGYGVSFPAYVESGNEHSFLRQLDQYRRVEQASRRAVELPAEWRDLLGHKAAPGLVFLTAGWLRAGLELIGDTVWTAETPAWVPYAVTQARRLEYGAADALAYATRQPPAAELRLLIGELRLATGDVERGRQELRSLATFKGPVGYRAAWLAGSAALERGQHAEVAEIVSGQPLLKDQAVGQELLAKSALAQGQTNRATEIYTAIADASIEARAYLARLAFARRDWKTARELTEALLMVMPGELALRRNLEQIAAAEAAEQ